MDRNLQILGLAKKAGLLAVGLQDTVCAARAGKARLIVSTSDASDSALRRARNSAESNRVLHIVLPYSSFELGNISGRGSPGTAAILDTGLAARFLRGLAETEPDRYKEPAELLQKACAHAKKKKHTPSGKRRTVQ